jgi:hypothetical protein
MTISARFHRLGMAKDTALNLLGEINARFIVRS